MLILTLEAVSPFRHERKNVDWKVKPSVVLILHHVLSSCGILFIHFINLPFYLSVTKVPACMLICTNMHRMQFCFHVYEAIVAALADEVIDCPTNRGKPGRTVANRGRTVKPPAQRQSPGQHRGQPRQHRALP